MTVAAKGAVLAGTAAGLALACSQPTTGLVKELINVTLVPEAASISPAVGLLPSVLQSVCKAPA